MFFIVSDYVTSIALEANVVFISPQMEDGVRKRRFPKFVALVGRDWHQIKDWLGQFLVPLTA